MKMVLREVRLGLISRKDALELDDMVILYDKDIKHHVFVQDLESIIVGV